MSRGKKSTHWGKGDHHNAKVHILAPDSGSTDSVYLYVETDTTVILLDKDHKLPKHPAHYRMHKKSDTNHHHSNHTMHHNDNKHHSNDTHHKK